MEEAVDMVDLLQVRNPYDASPYYEDARDKQREQERKEPSLFFQFKLSTRKRDVSGQLEKYMRALAAE
jgi:hypothetical protein